jgi:hypothetical protein
VNILLECPENKHWRKEICKWWLDINEEVVYRKILSCTNKITLRNVGALLYRVQCKWERTVKKTGI